MKIKRDSWAIIQAVIRRYPENKQLYEERRTELLEGTPVMMDNPEEIYLQTDLKQRYAHLTIPEWKELKEK